MQFRTDLAFESIENRPLSGIKQKNWKDGMLQFHHVTVGEKEAELLGKPQGKYVTGLLPTLPDHEQGLEEMAEKLGEQLRLLLPREGTVLVAGLGNSSITPDAIGPLTASRVLATRHIQGEFARSVGLENLRATAVISPDVLGNTGVESSEIVASVCKAIQAQAVIAVDALAARSLERLGCTVQLCDSGIAPGSGVGNNRKALCREGLGVPVIGLGVPTVVDAVTLAKDLTGLDSESITPNGTAMMVTPREVDLMVDRAARLLAMTIHAALQPSYSPLELLSLA